MEEAGKVGGLGERQRIERTCRVLFEGLEKTFLGLVQGYLRSCRRDVPEPLNGSVQRTHRGRGTEKF